MITKEGLISRLEKENIKVNILDFEVFEYVGDVWFAFSFEEGHTERMYKGGIDAETEDDGLVYTCGDDEEDYKEAVNAIKFSRISPYKDGVCGVKKMSKEYPCVHFEKGLCKLFTDDTTISYCLRSPCKQQQLSNADRIRAMSDEELAERDVNIILNVMAALDITNTGDPEEAVKIRLEWLKQPAEEDTE